MMRPSENFINIIKPDGSAAGFDLDELHLNVLQAFVRSDTPEHYLAEDVALAVEYALFSSGRPHKVFTESEVNNAVIKILEQTGLADAARYFRKRNSSVNLSVSARKQLIADLLTNHLSSAESDTDFNLLAEKVTEAMNKLNISEASPSLYMELARHYLNASSAKIELPLPTDANSEFISTEQIYKNLSTEAKELVEAEILQIAPISRRIFPSARIIFKLTKFAGYRELSAPITEMMISGELYKIGRILNAVILNIQTIYSTNTGNKKPLPSYLFVPDLEEFSLKWLLWSWPEARKSCLELLLPLNSSLYKLHCD